MGRKRKAKILFSTCGLFISSSVRPTAYTAPSIRTSQFQYLLTEDVHIACAPPRRCITIVSGQGKDPSTSVSAHLVLCQLARVLVELDVARRRGLGHGVTAERPQSVPLCLSTIGTRDRHFYAVRHGRGGSGTKERGSGISDPSYGQAGLVFEKLGMSGACLSLAVRRGLCR